MKKYALGLLFLLGACTWETVVTEEIVIDEPYVPAPMQVQNVQIEQAVTPQVYAIAATRATNRMLDETADIYENNGTTFLYIARPQILDETLPDGIHYARKVTKDIITGSNNYKVVNNLADADYILEASVENIGYEEDPVIEYSLILFDSQNNKINQWSETVRQLKNDDRSWW